MNNQLLSNYGPWALITGSSDGIGRSFAQQLAAQGFRLVLVARNQEKLERFGAELTRNYGSEVITIACDLSELECLDRIYEKTEGLEVGLLINNAGDAQIGRFLELDADRERALLNLNVVAPLLLSRRFGAEMCQRKRGGILFVSSTAAYFSMPFHGAYSAAKAFVLSLGESLRQEMGESNVDVSVVVPGPTKTGFQQRHPNIAWEKIPGRWLSSEEVAEAALKGIGKAGVIIPGTQNRLQALVASFLPFRKRILPVAKDSFKKVLKP